MSAIVNSSNINSALIQTIESGDSMVNNSIYNVKEVNPAYASNWVKNEPVSGTNPTASSTSNFNLQKYGIIQQILLTYQKKFSQIGTGTFSVEAGDCFNSINKIELLSSSRVISILTAEDLMAQFSNLQTDEFEVVQRTACGARAVSSGVGDHYHTYVVPLHFGFMDDPNLNLNSSFLETLSVRVEWGANLFNHTLQVADSAENRVTPATALTDCHLRILYKSLPEDATAQMLAENFSRDSLVQVADRWYDENSVKFTQGSADDANYKATVEIKNTDCVQSFYIIVREDDRAKSGLDQNGGEGAPVQIKTLKFTGSGQEIIMLDELEMPYTKLKRNGWATSGSVNGDTGQLFYIGKIQTGLYDNSKSLSNTMSMREINAGQIELTFHAVATKKYRIDVVENCTAIYQIASNTGRLSLALSN